MRPLEFVFLIVSFGAAFLGRPRSTDRCARQLEPGARLSGPASAVPELAVVEH